METVLAQSLHAADLLVGKEQMFIAMVNVAG